MRILIKIGGAQLEQPGPRRQLCESIHATQQAGHEVLIVHGGGNQIRTVGKALGLQDRYHEGLRITDKATAEAVLMVLGGSVNRTLVHALTTCAVKAVGITGADGATFSAKPIVRTGVNLGYVGSIDKVDGTLVETLLKSGHVPVIATVAPRTSAAGNEATDEPFFNINADHAAGTLCHEFDCDALLFLTDVDGVLDADGRMMPLLTDTDCDRLISTGVVAGGMQPKLESARRAAHASPHAIVKIASAGADNCVLAGLRDGAGTRFFAPAQQQAQEKLQHD
ncbi:MAG: acetylglutamate kinase [Planctomycetota bacterium]|jgi:acetylglutamate kinase